MTGWIFNASPVILLGKIHQLHLIEALSPEFRIPSAVIEEIGAGCSDDPAVKWLKKPSIADHIVDAPTAPFFLIQWDLERVKPPCSVWRSRKSGRWRFSTTLPHANSLRHSKCRWSELLDYWSALRTQAWLTGSLRTFRASSPSGPTFLILSSPVPWCWQMKHPDLRPLLLILPPCLLLLRPLAFSI